MNEIKDDRGVGLSFDVIFIIGTSKCTDHVVNMAQANLSPCCTVWRDTADDGNEKYGRLSSNQALSAGTVNTS